MHEDDDKIMKLLREALAEDDPETAEQIVEDNQDDYDGDIEEVAFRIAVQEGCYDYVENHYEDVELNDDGDCSSYLHETEDEGIIDLLTSVGAYRSWDEYSDCRFAVETVNDTVLAFDPDFQREVFDKLLQKLGLSEKQVAEKLDNGEADEYELPEDFDVDVSTLQEVCNLLLVNSDGDNIVLGEFDSMDDSVQSWVLRQLVESLGWNCSFEGEMWKFETNGVYFIE